MIRPSRDFVVNLTASYLHTKVSEDKLLPNPRDPGGGGPTRSSSRTSCVEITARWRRTSPAMRQRPTPSSPP